MHNPYYFVKCRYSRLVTSYKQCWSACVIDEYNQTLPVFIYCPVMMYKYYYEGKYIHKEVFKNIPHFIKTKLLVNYLHYGLLCTMIMYSLANERLFLQFLIIWYQKKIQKNQYVINFIYILLSADRKSM